MGPDIAVFGRSRFCLGPGNGIVGSALKSIQRQRPQNAARMPGIDMIAYPNIKPKRLASARLAKRLGIYSPYHEIKESDMKQVIEHVGQTDAGIDSYVIDGTMTGRHLTIESIKCIKWTMRQGEADTHDEKGLGYRIVHIGRGTDKGSDQWVEHIEIADPAAVSLGRKGGAAKSDRKTAAVRENAKKGGRPKKDAG